MNASHSGAHWKSCYTLSPFTPPLLGSQGTGARPEGSWGHTRLLGVVLIAVASLHFQKPQAASDSRGGGWRFQGAGQG